MSEIRERGIGIRILGLILIIAGYFGPWVPHKTAALAVTGLELAEFAKFFPQVQGGTVSLSRELFYLPLIAVFILLALLAGRLTRWQAGKPAPHRLARLIVPLLLAALLLVALLPYSIVDAVRRAFTTRSPIVLDPPYARQSALVVAGVVLILLAPLARRLPRRAVGILFALLALAAAVPVLWQFALLCPLVVALYGEPPGLGWGLIACVTGFLLLLLSGIIDAAGPGRSARSVSGVR
jgi:hypothetical protein